MHGSTWMLLIVLLCTFSLISIWIMWCALKTQETHNRSSVRRLPLLCTGWIAFVADAIGVGSFAVNMACLKHFRLVPNHMLPGALNGAQVLPGLIESLIFLNMIPIDTLTLSILIGGTCLGGVLGGWLVSVVPLKQVQWSMLCVFVFMSVLILANQLHVLTISSHTTQLRGGSLVIGFFGMMLCGIVPALGVGLFVLVFMFLFLLGVPPLLIFPIMTTAGALQQPLTTITFTFKKMIPLRVVFWLSLGGILGVCTAVPVVAHLSTYWLHWLLLLIIMYNAVMMWRTCRDQN